LTGRLLIPNLGAEEGPRWRNAFRAPAVPAVMGMAECWRLLFGDDAQFIEISSGPPEGKPSKWPSALGSRPEGPVFDWLDVPEGASAWLNTQEAVKIATEFGTQLSGPSPAAVSIVHDKAFTLRTAESEGLQPRALRGLIEVLEPDLLANPDAAIAVIEAVVARWPAWIRERFTLKPRFGSSGRGRIGGEGIESNRVSIRRGLARLAKRGGAMLEPWLDRTSDLSAQLHVGADGEITLLGTLEVCVSASGVYRGHRGFIDARGRVHAGTEHDEALREPAALLARRASEHAFSGPCGVDAFPFRNAEGREELRGAVEFNARTTTGTVIIGLLRRALPAVKAGIGILAEQRRAFYFALDAPIAGWPELGDDSPLQLIPLWTAGESTAEDSAATRPALLLGPDRAAIDAALQG